MQTPLKQLTSLQGFEKAMNNATPFSLRIFVADGDPDGLRLVERSNWIGKAVMFPRAVYTQIRKRKEFEEIGIYLLLGPQDSGEGELLYIGEGDPIRPRLEQHYAKKDFWTKAVFFVAGQGLLNKAHVQYLESRLIKLATDAKRVPLDNGNSPAAPTLSEADVADMEVFLANILGILPVLGIHAFEQAATIKEGGNPQLSCQGKGIVATGRDTTQGFVVYSGSFASKDPTPSLQQYYPAVCELRLQLVKSGVLGEAGGKLQFTQDYTFNSPSLAAAVIMGRSSNGRTEWKDSNGKTLKELQEAQAAQ